jgi:hypothetical protein
VSAQGEVEMAATLEIRHLPDAVGHDRSHVSLLCKDLLASASRHETQQPARDTGCRTLAV